MEQITKEQFEILMKGASKVAEKYETEKMSKPLKDCFERDLNRMVLSYWSQVADLDKNYKNFVTS